MRKISYILILSTHIKQSCSFKQNLLWFPAQADSCSVLEQTHAASWGAAQGEPLPSALTPTSPPPFSPGSNSGRTVRRADKVLVAVPLLGIRLGYLRSCYLSEVDLSGSLRCGKDHFLLLDGKAEAQVEGSFHPASSSPSSWPPPALCLCSWLTSSVCVVTGTFECRVIFFTSSLL